MCHELRPTLPGALALPPLRVRTVPRAQAVLYLIDQLIIPGILLHIGVR